MADFARLENLFFGALAKTQPEERQQYLDVECGQDADLREQVERLLAGQNAAGSFLEKPAATQAYANNDASRESELVGSQVGPYKLLQKLGEGGMGTVWVAEQEKPVKRRVALKLIKAGMDSAQVIRRFEAERQALALMDHTNIAKVLDAGTTTDGRPYFVMELVKGVPITKYCDEVHASIKNRLDLFVQVCSAVQHAHQKGIIHRDIKPSNILIAMQDGKPVPKVIDFGVAKALHSRLADQSMYTEIGQIIGTLEYMAPEQAELSAMDIDTRADIYALGVLLYELLTGSTPITRERMKSAAFAEVIRLIKEEDPPKPSTRLTQSKESLANLAALRKTDPKHLSSELKGELDWVVLKALEKDRTCRYETANGLARDIQRYLADEVVDARPPSAGYRLRKFVRRNKGKVLAAGLIALALVLGVIGTTWGLLEAKQHERFAMEAAVQERHAKHQAEEEKTKALKSAEAEKTAKLEAERNLTFAKKGNDILGSVFAGLDPEARYATVAELRNALRDNLTKAVKELEGSAVGDPLEVATMQEKLGVSLLGLGEANQAIDLFTKEFATRKERLGADHPDTLSAMGNLAVGYYTVGKLDKALPLLEESLRLSKTKMGIDHPETLKAMGSLAVNYKETGNLNRAISLMEETLKLAVSKLGNDHQDTLSYRNNLSIFYRKAGKFSQAISLAENTHTISTAKLGADHPDTLSASVSLATTYEEAGKTDQAIMLLEETLKLSTTKMGAGHPITLKAKSNLAMVYKTIGKMNQALPLMEETFNLRKSKLGADHPETLASMNHLAIGYQAIGKLDIALPLLEELLTQRNIILGKDHPDTLSSMSNLAVCYQSAGKLEKAVPLLEEAYHQTKTKLGPDHPSTLVYMNNLAEAHKAQNQHDKAMPLLEEALKRTNSNLGPDHPNTLTLMSNLARTYRVMGRVEEGLSLFERAAAGIDRRQFQHEHAKLIIPNTISAYERAGKFDKAESWQRKWMTVVKEKSGTDSLGYAGELASFGKLLGKQQKWSEAEHQLRESLAIRTKLQPEAWTTFNSQSLLGGALMGQKKYSEAEPLLLKGYQGMKKNEVKIPATGKQNITEALDRLIQLYTETNKPDEVKKWQAEKDKLAKPLEKK